MTADAPFVPRMPPAPEGLAAEFYARAATGRLHVQRCGACGTWRHPPRVRCAACGSDRVVWEAVGGRGRVYTWTVVHQALVPAFAEDLPYAVAVVELDEGVRLVSAVRGLPPERLATGLEVECAIVRVSETIGLHWFRPIGPAR